MPRGNKSKAVTKDEQLCEEVNSASEQEASTSSENINDLYSEALLKLEWMTNKQDETKQKLNAVTRKYNKLVSLYGDLLDKYLSEETKC